MIISTLLSLLLAPGASVEPPPGEPAPVHEEMVVTAERGPEALPEVPAAVSVLTRREIERLPAESLAELLEFLPGFHAFFREGLGGAPPIVAARGFFGGGEADYVQLRIDGVPVEDVESGLADWRRIRASDIERIEALRGPASSLYGDTALAGVIQVFTRRAPADGSEAAAALSGGSFGTLSADASWRAGRPGLAGGISATYDRTDGHREHSAEDLRGLDLDLLRPAGGGELSLALSGTRDGRDEPGALTREQFRGDASGSDPLFRFDHTDTDRGRAVLGYRRETGGFPLRASLWGQARNASILRTLLVAPGLGDRTFREVTSRALGGSLEGERLFTIFSRESRLRAGTELARESLDTDYRSVGDSGGRDARIASGGGRRNRLALFVTQDWRPSERVRVTGGIRWDRIADDFRGEAGTVHQAWSPRLGVNVRVLGPAEPLSLFVQASRAFKAPTLDQLFDPHPFSDFQGGTFTISNSALLPQKAETIEAGLSRATRSSRYELVAYRTAVDDEIDFDPASFRYRNIGRSLHRGIEASGRYAVGPLTPFLSYAWTRVEAREGEDRGRQLKNVPEHLVRAGVDASLPAGFTVEAVWTHLARRYLDDANRVPLGNASVVDLRVGRSFGPLRARLDLSNLTNTRYAQYGFALSDFSGGSVPFYYPAARFAARIGLEWRR